MSDDVSEIVAQRLKGAGVGGAQSVGIDVSTANNVIASIPLVVSSNLAQQSRQSSVSSNGLLAAVVVQTQDSTAETRLPRYECGRHRYPT